MFDNLPTRKEIDDFHELMSWAPLEIMPFVEKPGSKLIIITSDRWAINCKCGIHTVGNSCAMWIEMGKHIGMTDEQQKMSQAVKNYLELIGKRRRA